MTGRTYTPTTRQVEDFWASDGTEQPAAKSHDRAEGVAEFRRWLAQHDREIAARAWREGAQTLWARTSEGWNSETAADYTPDGEVPFLPANDDIPNPYEQEEA